jgi:hypothetical protein
VQPPTPVPDGFEWGDCDACCVVDLELEWLSLVVLYSDLRTVLCSLTTCVEAETAERNLTSVGTGGRVNRLSVLC